MDKVDKIDKETHLRFAKLAPEGVQWGRHKCIILIQDELKQIQNIRCHIEQDLNKLVYVFCKIYNI